MRFAKAKVKAREWVNRCAPTYDPLGRRIGKASCAVVPPNYSAGRGWRPAEIARINSERGYGMTTFGWDGDALAWECSARALVHYLYEPGASFVPMVQLRREARGNQWGPQRLAWYQCGHLGTPMELTDDKGKIVWEGDYKAFGKAKATSFDGFTNNIRFQGQYFDEETGMHYNRYRYYNPGAGRYISKDPIGLNGGSNQFGYVGGNPLSYTDPTGLETYICTRPLGGAPGSYAPPVLNHTYVCVGSGANMTCGSTTASSGGAISNIFGSSPGKPTTSVTDYYKPEACERRQGQDSCIETCIANELKKPTRPKYGVGPSGTDCQEYTEDVVSTCERRCVRR
ncbi:RHS repeat-associated core domain-containing protein [Variovorax sp. J22P271]|uniref:RHS repeat domain-containing protein n=1 Tax=Variovorax davisae TaxID=3053515 RepID=UPI0025779613|nr:RHS repeat-associated core domain-containing protein [Variovorax sp. J22P271]MDM0031355.1 RHS repeat-associated core domain-containing protein [Variovorax sp. J22P271]